MLMLHLLPLLFGVSALQSGEGSAAGQSAHGGGDHLAPRPQQAPPYQHRHRGRTGEENPHALISGGAAILVFFSLLSSGVAVNKIILHSSYP